MSGHAGPDQEPESPAVAVLCASDRAREDSTSGLLEFGGVESGSVLGSLHAYGIYRILYQKARARSSTDSSTPAGGRACGLRTTQSRGKCGPKGQSGPSALGLLQEAQLPWSEGRSVPVPDDIVL